VHAHLAQLLGAAELVVDGVDLEAARLMVNRLVSLRRSWSLSPAVSCSS